eukprot:CAMPEP_0119109242 /NCGR_PEP_ID=MMETSP1180-20130426/17804_1 /TAXON_ID=3052 ORGANISM="Chlamydomonas cf sp, Strain CCMP681" /NCGR_SAMPLE_ID=MMETSP1180 /ASSEMBLY_ACC=CAM_ASM_000741 /LENGTH=250 /DNA_ID=CAMNT_0007094981 /DNA_START=80 /DNA_END=832 /DNA_ORIENTATION=+
MMTSGVGHQGVRLRPSRQSLSVEARTAGFGKPASSVPKDLAMPKGTPTVKKLEWQSPLQVVKYPDPRLRVVNAKVAVFDENLLALAREMIQIMYQDDGVGLAAPQVGVNIRLMVFNPVGRTEPGNETILVNPEIISISGPRLLMEEGCLSFPGLQADVERARDLVVRGQNEKGEPITLTLGGEDDENIWIGRIFQHEYDHLQGILFHDRMKPVAVDTLRSALVALEDGFVAAHPAAKIKRLEAPKAAKGV